MPAAQPAPQAEETAAGAPSNAPAVTPPSALKTWLPLVVTVVVMPLLAFGMTKWVLIPELRKGLGSSAPASSEAKGRETTAASDAKQESVTMNKLLVNVAGTMGARYLLVSVSITGTDPDFKAKMQAHDPQLRDMACGALASKTLADLEKPGIRNLIRTELMSGFNGILGGPVVQEIYLTEFAIQ